MDDRFYERGYLLGTTWVSQGGLPSRLSKDYDPSYVMGFLDGVGDTGKTLAAYQIEQLMERIHA